MKVAAVTGTRADYGLLAPLLQKIDASPLMDLQIVVTGTHLLQEFGHTIDEILRDGFPIAGLVPEVGSAQTGADVARQVGAGTSSFAEILGNLSPDVMIVLGDRFEILAAVNAAFFMGIPILHLHGGEVTNGAFDDAVRHAISKFSTVHAVAASVYGERLVRMGEQPDSVHVVGGFGVDALSSSSRLSIFELQRELGITIRSPLLLVTYHPVTAEAHDTEAEIQSLVAALKEFTSATVVFTLPNGDPENGIISHAVRRSVTQEPNWHLFSAMGSKLYLSLLASSSVIVGNSSSGILEAPSFGVPTVNIGPRQAGRLMGASILCCEPTSNEIVEAVRTALSDDFVELARAAESPYGAPGASDRVMEILERTDFANLGGKTFYDPPTKVR